MNCFLSCSWCQLSRYSYCVPCSLKPWQTRCKRGSWKKTAARPLSWLARRPSLYPLLPDAAVEAADALSSLLSWLTQRTQPWCGSNATASQVEFMYLIHTKPPTGKRHLRMWMHSAPSDQSCYIIIICKMWGEGRRL